MSRPAVVERLLAHEVSMSASPNEMAQLRAYIEALERDAARYRWLRSGQYTRQGQPTEARGRDIDRNAATSLMHFRFWCPPADLDAAIDAAQGQGDGRG